MTHKQVETSRELRLWIGQVAVPAAMAIIAAMQIPEIRDVANTKVKDIKQFVQNKFKKN